MKIQALNKTQQKRLLSLCKEFFPEYEYIWWNSCYLTIVFEGGKSSNNKSIDIHWYQLCLTELPKRIFNKTNKIWSKIQTKYFYGGRNYTEITQALCFSQEHPVDFLWNLVKECKKNNYFKKKINK